MRTTLTLEDDLAEQLRSLSAKLRRPFKRVVNDTIRRGLAGQTELGEIEPFRVEPHPCRLRPGIDDRRFHQLADELEIEERARKLKGAS